jgi:hypothetical protein
MFEGVVAATATAPATASKAKQEAGSKQHKEGLVQFLFKVHAAKIELG